MTSTPATETSLRALLALAWPIVLARATQSVVGFTDALMVAPLGEETLAAVTTGSLNTFAIGILPMGTVFIVQSFAAQLSGRGDLASVRRYALYGLCIAAFAGLAGLIAIPAIAPLVHLLGYAPAVESQLTDYLTIRMLGVAAFVGTEALGNWYGGLGNTRMAMVAGVITMVANIAGNYALIEPRFGLPGYGAAGAAWASTGACFLGFFVLLFSFLRGLGCGHLPKAHGALQRRELMRVLRFGLPNGMNWFLEFGAFLLFINVVVGHLGTTALAAMMVVMQVNSVSFMPAFGVASSGAILVGNAIGAKAHDRVWPIVKLTLSVTACWMGAIGALYWVAPTQVIGLFQADDGVTTNLVAVGTTMLLFSTFWQLFDAVAMTLSEILRAAGDTAFTMKARIVLAWVFFTPVAWSAVLLWGGGIVTVMLCVIGYLGLLAAVFAYRFASGVWRNIDLLGDEAALLDGVTDSPRPAS
jgi:multidrug resistance protein, MATE family